jgi:non-canonical poly(A) RNA polymerase PAPD5/7
LFGSNAIGLSLPNSDVDILLCGIDCTLKEDASDFLAQIAVEINAMGWVVSCSTYLSAKVPIIKLEIDPSIPFLHTKRRQDLFRVYNPAALYYLDTDKCPPGRTIKVDITININGISSIGYESTLLMK